MIDAIVQYYLQNVDKVSSNFLIHIGIVMEVMGIVLVLGVPLGYLCYKYEKLSVYITGVINLLRVVPSLALMILILPFLGIGQTPAIVALSVLALPPMIINTKVGFESIDRMIIETAVGMGMDTKQILLQIEIPLALPLVISGIRTAAVETIASTSIATYIGAGGLGVLVYGGLATNKLELLLLGGLSIAVIALLTDLVLALLQKIITKNLAV